MKRGIQFLRREDTEDKIAFIRNSIVVKMQGVNTNKNHILLSIEGDLKNNEN